MKNYYQLLDLFGFENISAIQELTEDIRNDFAETFHAMQINKTTRRNAFEKFIKQSNVYRDEAIEDVYCDGHAIISNGMTASINKTARVADILTGAFSKARPVDVYLRESATVARIMGWKPGNKDYFIDIDGNIFCWDLVYSVYACIADSDLTRTTEFCSLTGVKGYNALVMRSKHGVGYVLPLERNACPAYLNVNFRHFTDTMNRVDAELVNQALKTA